MSNVVWYLIWYDTSYDKVTYDVIWYYDMSEWMIKFNGFSRTANIDIHMSLVILIYTLESLFPLTQITHIAQITINIRKK